jgi:hypothetical protein
MTIRLRTLARGETTWRRKGAARFISVAFSPACRQVETPPPWRDTDKPSGPSSSARMARPWFPEVATRPSGCGRPPLSR